MSPTTRLTAAAITAFAATVTLTSCGKGDGAGAEAGSKPSASSRASEAVKTDYRLGQPSSTQPHKTREAEGTWTVTPRKAVTGTPEDMRNSGLNRKGKEAKVPVFVWSVLAHQGGGAMTVKTMKKDLQVRTDQETRTKELMVLFGSAKWRGDCPAFNEDTELKKGDQVKICTVHLVPEGEKAEAVELFQGYNARPLEWPVTA